MATLLSSLETQVRRTPLLESSASFWSSAQLIDFFNHGIKDLWGAIIDLHQEHFLTIDITNVSQAADTKTLTGVPSDVFRIHSIEPRDTTSAATGAGVIYVPRDDNSFEMIGARAQTAQDPSTGLKVYYFMSQAGAPVGAPTVHVAPMLSSALTLRFAYVPILAAVAANGNNPIPGESDNALIAWCGAYARSAERDDRSPDPNWLAVYATEKAQILTRLTPRQTQEPDVVDDYFGAWMPG